MKFEGKALIDGEPQRVWDVLLDVDRFAACMPGVEEVRQVDDHTFDGFIRASVGPIAGNFAFRATILDATPPTNLTARVEGSDSVTKSKLTGTNVMTLTPIGEAKTELGYTATVEVQGRLAILGDMLLRTTASLLLDEFTKRLRRQVEGG